MTTEIDVDGETYELSNNPSMGCVRDVQNMRLQILRDKVGDDRLREMDSFDESDFVDIILDEHGFEGLTNMMWEQSMLEACQTISLAMNEAFTVEEANAMNARDFMELHEAAEEELGGDAEHFFDKLGIGISLTQSQIQQAQQA